jgi:hypothetical protein
MFEPWEMFEREVAIALGGYRICRDDAHRESAPDVIVRDLNLVVDAKLRREFTHGQFIQKIREKYCKHGEIPLLVHRVPGEAEAYVSLRLVDFQGLIAEVRAAKKGLPVAS